MKLNASIILSIVAIVGVVSVWLLWLCDSIKLSVVSLDTFIGVIVALLALIFTISVGYQIINAIEIKRKMKELEQKQDCIDSNYQNYTKLASNLQAGISGSAAELYYAKGEFFEAFVFYHSALYFAITADQMNQMGRVYQLNGILQLSWNYPVMDYKLGIAEVNQYRDKIRNTTSYRNCLSKDYEQVINQFWNKLRALGYEI